MNHEKRESNRRTTGGTTYPNVTDIQDGKPQVRLQRIEDTGNKNITTLPSYQTGTTPNEDDEPPRLRRTKMPSAKVLERRERQRAMNERIGDTFFDRINGNFFPKEQIEE